MTTETKSEMETTDELTSLGASGGSQYLSFSLGEEHYGIDILTVQEIIGYTATTAIPNAPDFIPGVINLRGTVIPIFDLRKKFNMTETNYDKYSVIIVVNIHEKTMGMIVDSVSDVLSIDEENIQDVPEFSDRIETEFIKGMAKTQDKLVVLLDLSRVLTVDDIQLVNQSTLPQEPADPPKKSTKQTKKKSDS